MTEKLMVSINDVDNISCCAVFMWDSVDMKKIIHWVGSPVFCKISL